MTLIIADGLGQKAGAVHFAEHHDLWRLPHGLSWAPDCARVSWARVDLGERA